MSANVRVISCPDFVRHDAAGAFDADATRACLAEIAAHCAATGVKDALLDVREVVSAPSIPELFWIANDLRTLGFTSLRRLAVVFTDLGGGRATFFATSAKNHGFNVREFTEFEGAFNWLSTPTA